MIAFVRLDWYGKVLWEQCTRLEACLVASPWRKENPPWLRGVEVGLDAVCKVR